MHLDKEVIYMKYFAILIGILLVFIFTTHVQASQACACYAPSSIPTQVPTEILPSEGISPTVEVSPEVTESPTATPEATVEPTIFVQTHGDDRSDGRESGHINAPSIPSAPPKTGRAW
jgi:hypothetical protein